MGNLNNDQVSSGGLFFIGLAISLRSISYELGSPSSPDSGFMPFLTGVGISLLAIVGFIHSTLRKKKGEAWFSILQGRRWDRALVILISLLAWALLLVPLGFFLCTSLFIAFLLRGIVPQRWPVVIVGALLTATASYVIFEIWLKAQLPKGILGI
jgi:putative tricarboxylic transport membrane protein